MSFSFFKPSKARSSPSDLLKVLRESLLALDTKTVAKAHEEIGKNIVSMRQMLSGDGEAEPNQEQISQIALEICKENVHYNNKEIALNCGNMLRERIKYPTFANALSDTYWNRLALNCFKYVELSNFDIASAALANFKDVLAKHETAVAQFLGSHYEQLYEKLLTSTNYVTRRQSLKFLSEFLLEPPNSQIRQHYILDVRHLKIMMALLKDSSKNIQICALHIFKVFVANPNKPCEIIEVLAKNHAELLMLHHNLPTSKGEDEQLEEERGLIIKEIERFSNLSQAAA